MGIRYDDRGDRNGLSCDGRSVITSCSFGRFLISHEKIRSEPSEAIFEKCYLAILGKSVMEIIGQVLRLSHTFLTLKLCLRNDFLCAELSWTV